MTRAALAKLSLLGIVAVLATVSEGCSRGAQLTSLALTPTSATIEVGKPPQTFKLDALFDDGTKAPITSGITWSSSNVSVASVSTAGEVTGVSAGSATITASAQGLSAQASVSVTPLGVASIAATPNPVSVAAGLTAQLAVTATMDDGSTQPVTAGSTYESSAPTIATVSPGGKITGVTLGTAVVTVTASSQKTTVPVTVTAATIVSLAVTPNTISKIEGQTQQLAVSATYTDGAVKAPDAVTYLSSDATKVTVSASGLVTAVAVGGANVTVTAGGKSVVVPVTVTAKTLLSIAATPDTVTLPSGGSQQITVVGTYDNNATSTLSSGQVTFSTSAASKATVSSTGLITGVAAGPATITVSAGSGINATVAVTVTTEVFVSLAITPAVVPAAGGKFFAGQTQPLTVVGTYSGTTPAATVPSANITWTSSAPGVATVATGSVLTAVSAGTATITASVATSVGPVTQTLAVTVTAQTLVSIAAGASTVQVGVGATSQLVITATYDGGPTRDVTANSTFTSTDALVASVTSPGGLVSGVKFGTATITATYSGKSTTVGVNVGSSGKVFFAGAYDPGVSFVSNADSFALNDISVDSSAGNLYNGSASLKVNYPLTGHFTGGSFVSATPRDLSSFNAVSFWAKGNANLTSLEVVGVGDDALGHTTFAAENKQHLALTTTYQQYILPLPLGAAMTSVNGLFYFADGATKSPSSSNLATLWLADIQYVKLSGTPGGTPAVAFNTTTTSLPVTQTYQISPPDLGVTFSTAIAGSAAPSTFIWRLAGPGYFTFTSDSAAAAVTNAGLITAGAANGTANITAKLGTASSSNKLAVTVIAPLPKPATLPPLPAKAAGASVVSIWSSATPGGLNGTASDYSTKVNFAAYGVPTTNVPLTVGSTSVSLLRYTLNNALGYAGLGWDANPINASTLALDTLHIDVWTADFATVVGAVFKVQLTDKSTGVTKVAQIFPTASSSPPLANGQWLSYDLKLSTDFGYAALPTTLYQVGFVAAYNTGLGNGGTFYIDNVYFFSSGGGSTGGTGPTAAPADPTAAAANVISLFSAKYTGGTAGGDYSGKVDSYAATCFGAPGSATVADYTIPGTSHKVKQYTASANAYISIETIGATGGTTPNGDSASCNGGTQTGTNLIDVSQMTGLHFDVWASKAAATFNGAVYTAPTLPFNTGAGATSVPLPNKPFAAGTWVPIDITFGDLSAITKLSLVQIYTGEGGTIYLDNIYFSKAGGGTGGTPFAPVTFDDAAKTYKFTGFGGGSGTKVPDPTNSLNNVGKLVKSAPPGTEIWGGVTISTGALDSVGKIPFTSSAKTMSVKFYSPRAGVSVHLKVEDSTNGAINAEQAVNTTQANTWETLVWDFTGTSLDLSKTYDKVSLFPDFGNIPVADETFYCDDIVFGGTVTVPSAPTTLATTPTAASANVVSLYNSSATYTDQTGTNWNAFGNGGLTEADYTVVGPGKVVKKYGNLGYVGVDFTAVNVATTGVNFLHLDLWTPNGTQFGVKFGAGGAGGANQVQVDYTNTVIKQGQWVSLDVPLTGLPAGAAGLINEILWVDNQVANPNENGTFFIDNVYFYKVPPVAPTAPPTPPTPLQANVTSLFSAAYASYIDPSATSAILWHPNYGDSTVFADVTIAGEPMKKYSNINYFGIQFDGVCAAPPAAPGVNCLLIDATTKSNFHVDVWTADATTMKFKLVDAGANRTLDNGGGDDSAAEVQVTLTPGQWTAIDIPMSTFVANKTSTAAFNYAHLGQLIPSTVNGSKVVFLDNIYFH